MSKFLSEKYSGLTPYTPGEQPRDRSYIKLNTNESPYPPSPRVLSALTSGGAEALQLYPDPTCYELKNLLAQAEGCMPENIFLGNGSDEVLSFIFMAYCNSKNGAAFADVTYGFYNVFAGLYGIDAAIIPLKEDFSLDYTDYLSLGKNIFIANPNAPSGLALSPSDIEKIIESNGGNIVTVDEAYVDFGAQSCSGLVDKYDNLIVVRTFSKSRSLAGARVGYAIANASLINDLETLKYSTNPYNISRMGLAAAAAATLDKEYYDKMCGDIVRTRENVKSQLEKLGCTYTDSKTNFLYLKAGGISGAALYEKLKCAGILVRHFDSPRTRDYIRVTVGTDLQMETFIDTLSNILTD